MRSFESRSPRDGKAEDGEKTGGGPAPASSSFAGPAPAAQTGGHLYKSKPTPPAARPDNTGGTAGQGRLYYSKKKNGGTAVGPRPPPGGPQKTHGGTAVAKRTRFASKQTRLYLMLGALVLVLIISLALAALLPGCQQATAASGSLSASSAAASIQTESYNKDELAIPQGEYAGTILEETEDAGDDYVADTLFIGDSNTERMVQLSNITGVTMKNGIGIESMGIGSVTSLRCVRFSGYNDMTIPQAVKVMQPRRIVIMFGTNNVGMYTESFIAQYEIALDAIEEAWPYADIIVGSVLPITQNCSYGSISQKAIDAFNLALVEMAQARGCKFLNWSDALKDARTGYAKSANMISDGVHISADGLRLLFEYFRTHSYVTDDTRPKPLQAIPTRLPTPEGLFPKPDSSASASASSSGSASDSSSSSSSSSTSASASLSQAPSSAPASSAPAGPASISVSVASRGGGAVSGGGAGTAGSSVTFSVTITPEAGYVFAGWESGTYSEGKLTVGIPAGQTENLVIYAIFHSVETASDAGGPAADAGG